MRLIASVEEVVYNEIKQRIVDGRLLPGTRLVLRTLAKELKASLVPVVSALRMLERDGLVINTPGMGACVRQWSAKEIRHLYLIREMQEGLAARLCAEEAGPSDLASIVAADEMFRKSIDARDADANIRADIDFHTAVVRGAHSLDLERMTENLSIMRCSMRAFGISRNVRESFVRDMRLAPERKEVHKPIVDAILAREPIAAEQAGRAHVQDSLSKNLVWIEEIAEEMNSLVVNGEAVQSFSWAR
ncbi:MAG: GntR family transcriptional regulator [Armatimonadetes bacterium]|nr:GntR family transcriptional regulator [Armatimonadota bacterium]